MNELRYCPKCNKKHLYLDVRSNSWLCCTLPSCGYYEKVNNKVEEIIKKMNKMTSEERYEIIHAYCTYCGSLDNNCQCWNDE